MEHPGVLSCFLWVSVLLFQALSAPSGIHIFPHCMTVSRLQMYVMLQTTLSLLLPALWILHFIPSTFSSQLFFFFGGSFIGMSQSFMMGMHSSIVACVTWNFNYSYMTSRPTFFYDEDTSSTLAGGLRERIEVFHQQRGTAYFYFMC